MPSINDAPGEGGGGGVNSRCFGIGEGGGYVSLGTSLPYGDL